MGFELLPQQFFGQKGTGFLKTVDQESYQPQDPLRLRARLRGLYPRYRYMSRDRYKVRGINNLRVPRKRYPNWTHLWSLVVYVYERKGYNGSTAPSGTH
jgi:hypothetical protein